MRLFQTIGWALSGYDVLEQPKYAEHRERDYLGEDDRGDLRAYEPRSMTWHLFNPFRSSHLKAARNTRRTGYITYL